MEILNKILLDKSYINGYEPSQADVSVFNSIKSVDATLPNVARWYKHIKSYEFSTLPGEPGKPASFYLPVEEKQQQQEQGGEDDDDVDLFGSDDEEAEAEIAKKHAERIAAYNDKKASKSKAAAKSIVTLEVKPWDDETDMKELENYTRSVEMEGLVWGGSQLVAIGYGIK